MKNVLHIGRGRLDDVVFRPAVTPLEAAVLPAMERKSRAALCMIRRACDAGACTPAQRAKIWVR